MKIPPSGFLIPMNIIKKLPPGCQFCKRLRNLFGDVGLKLHTEQLSNACSGHCMLFGITIITSENITGAQLSLRGITFRKLGKSGQN